MPNPCSKPNWTLAEVLSFVGAGAEPAAVQYWTLVNAYLANEREEEAGYSEMLFHYQLGDDAEDAAQFIAEQRWAAKSNAA